jgi:chorismate dehydratase
LPTEAPRRSRIAAFRYLNSLPLLHGLIVRPLPGCERIELSLGTPAESAQALADGRADAALIPSIEAARIPGLRHLPGIAIATDRRVRSVIVAASRPLDRCRSLALDASSRTSVALLRVLLARRFQCRPELEVMPPDPEAMLKRHDGALLIADHALRPLPPGLIIIDLAEEWHALTGLPFVFALWAVRDGAAFGSVEAELLASSLEAGQRALPEIAASDGVALGLTAAEAHAYLRENLSYRLGVPERAGLVRFLALAAEEGLLPGCATPPPAWAAVAGVTG